MAYEEISVNREPEEPSPWFNGSKKKEACRLTNNPIFFNMYYTDRRFDTEANLKF
ncbi:hypothetical protein [Neobacillus muris]|uniref:hypothetical protein n=1 Tax=Neobacillus muris TaxID=2941334 RepID=UPI00203F95B4|nr:hypothetical protein [Neobacillus muris]